VAGLNNWLVRCVALSFVGLVSGACLSATEIRLHISTNIACTEAMNWKGVAVYAGAPGSVEHKEASFTTKSCDANGQVGSVVIVPSGEKDAELGLRVVAGITRNPEECAAHNYDGCIVARRSVRFSRHATLDLNFDLTSDCVGKGCDATHTCVDKICTDARSSSPPPVDTGEPTVRCGDNGVVCPTTGDVCCLTADPTGTSTRGECMDPEQCPPTSTVLYCDDESDCTASADDAGHPGMCLLMIQSDPSGIANAFVPSTASVAECLPYSGFLQRSALSLELCQSRAPCWHGTVGCIASTGYPTNPLPGYHWCELNGVN